MTSNPTEDDIHYQILDAASDLFLHYGYDKTTIQEIARHAGISKGSLYLRWNKKEDIFHALMRREGLRYLDEWLRRVEADPEGGTFPGVYTHALGSLLANPFMAAIYRQDRKIFGSMIQQLGTARFYVQRQQSLLYLFRRLQDEGIVRETVDAPTLVYILNSLNYGLIQMPAILNTQGTPPLEEVLQMVVAMIQGFVSPEAAADSERGKAVLRDYVSQIRNNL